MQYHFNRFKKNYAWYAHACSWSAAVHVFKQIYVCMATCICMIFLKPTNFQHNFSKVAEIFIQISTTTFWSMLGWIEQPVWIYQHYSECPLNAPLKIPDFCEKATEFEPQIQIFHQIFSNAAKTIIALDMMYPWKIFIKRA